MKHHTTDPNCPLCEEKLQSAHVELVDWYRSFVKVKFPDAHVSWSYRDQESQDAAFEDGKTKLHYPKSAHNKMPSLALDLFRIQKGIAQWEPSFFIEIHALTVKTHPEIIWGGNWKTLGDLDHFELLPEKEEVA